MVKIGRNQLLIGHIIIILVQIGANNSWFIQMGKNLIDLYISIVVDTKTEVILRPGI